MLQQRDKTAEPTERPISRAFVRFDGVAMNCEVAARRAGEQTDDS